MGIPHLIELLQSYAVSTDFACKASDCPKHRQRLRQERIVIDGPGLVYHVHGRILARKRSGLSALNVAPSYNEIGQAVITFLKELERYALTM